MAVSCIQEVIHSWQARSEWFRVVYQLLEAMQICCKVERRKEHSIAQGAKMHIISTYRKIPSGYLPTYYQPSSLSTVHLTSCFMAMLSAGISWLATLAFSRFPWIKTCLSAWYPSGQRSKSPVKILVASSLRLPLFVTKPPSLDLLESFPADTCPRPRPGMTEPPMVMRVSFRCSCMLFPCPDLRLISPRRNTSRSNGRIVGRHTVTIPTAASIIDHSHAFTSGAVVKY